MDKTSCTLCKKEMSFNGFRKHFFSFTHAQDIIDAIHKRKAALEDWVKSYEKSPASTKHPTLLFTNNVNDSLYFCNVCKTVRPVKNGNRPTCTHFKEIAEFIKHSLTQTPTAEQFQETPSVSTKELEDMKKKIASLEKQLKVARDIQNDLTEENDRYFTCISHMHDEESSSYEVFMEVCKTKAPELHNKIEEDLGYGK